MNDTNPYAPPKAPVADIEKSPPPQAPSHVVTCCQLMWIGLGLSALYSVVDTFLAPDRLNLIASIVSGVVVLGIGYLIVRWVTAKLLAGRNWMRWLVTVINVLSWLAVPLAWDFYMALMKSIMVNPILALITLVQTVLGVVAIVLLHTTASRRWFAGGAPA